MDAEDVVRLISRDEPVAAGRFATLRGTLAGLAEHLAGLRDVLDFGAGSGLSLVAIREAGAGWVIGIEPDRARVERGAPVLAACAPALRLLHVADTRALPFPDAFFDTVLANAVLEHIPQPRDAYIREMWRVLRPRGVLIVNETPNVYVPFEGHTTGLWCNHWLPSGWAHRRAVRRGRFGPARTDWASSGWRGLGYRELVRPLRGDYDLVPERSRLRHRVLSALGLPASLVDPYPTWILRKRG